MLIKRVYEVDPMACPKCGAEMQVVSFIEPPQGDVIEKILKHCGLWHPRPPPGDCPPRPPDGPPSPSNGDGGPSGELTYVPFDVFEATF